ncbi:PEP/pyruvate-binding domain-containing protein [Streptomyces termitum]|uniref:Pyruvate, phosphate dikinase n=1 Tax=Streptomyces termitum TaxID=67368 RepID=A0A918SYJ2_9ACTN|nr:PEP/pyruvate-binding domain-containing protein [Streptomyces termitum]GHA74767.1 pyruvate, phosphate dikinase [Streptomyces termitum]
MAEDVVSLAEAAELPVERVGGKARGLGRLVAAGFPVPPGFCLPVDAFTATAGLAEDGEDGKTGKGGEDAGGSGLRRDAVARVKAYWEALPSPHGVAVRSSATDEDGAAGSAAGQYESVLGVRTFDELLAAVGRCQRSRHSAASAVYRNRIGLTGQAPAMAVVVQAMVAPTWAGVLFTAEAPVADDDHLVLVEAVEGLGDQLVDGTVEPDRAAFSRREPHAPVFSTVFGERMGGTDDDEGPLRSLVRTALAVERALGGPQDIEWALDATGLHLLQARPITAAVPPPTRFGDWASEVPGARWARMSICDSWLSDPLSPLFATTLFPALIDRWATNWGGPRGLRARSPLIPEPMHGTVNGFAYLRFDFPLSRYPLRTLRLTARWLAFHLSPVERLWRNDVLPALRAGLEHARDAPLDELTSAEVLRRVRAVEDLSARYWAVIGGLAWHWNTTEWLLGAVLARGGRRTAGLTPGSLLVGEDRLAHQADRALERIASAPEEDEERLLREYLHRFGHLVYSLDPAEPTAADDPSMLRSVIAGRRADGAPGSPAPGPGGAPAPRLGGGPLGPLRRGVHRWANHWSGVRDEALHHFTLGWPFMRAGYLELGRRLVLAGLLDADEDVFYLTGRELSDWVSAGAGDARWRELVRERRLRRRWQRRLDPPDVVPADARITLFGSDITSLALFGTERGNGEGDGLSGSAVSPGSYTGRARVIHEVADADALEPGEVLVVRQVTPAWAPLLTRAGAVVADVGGALSHGSVVAREYGIPAVMGVRTGTSRIGTGDTVTVDGDTGTVRSRSRP